MILGNIATAAGNGGRACEGYRASAAAFERARRLGPLIGMNEQHAATVEKKIALCD